ncbi:hypothetical protein N7468_001693 [Penicillium chermesinum]|uniref:Uncharacterized protein n=1 Tax=Penicillium chermesinum TaxID=63820 RepID=A0A9W9PH32_9EURO|nr:uncharacterized protein N7468_001693 [Penicillium chermesinum]KAJ5246710.1 hypothetical protein N7468_001693 [Penicillium chermesinum]
MTLTYIYPTTEDVGSNGLTTQKFPGPPWLSTKYPCQIGYIIVPSPSWVGQRYKLFYRDTSTRHASTVTRSYRSIRLPPSAPAISMKNRELRDLTNCLRVRSLDIEGSSSYWLAEAKGQRSNAKTNYAAGGFRQLNPSY